MKEHDSKIVSNEILLAFWKVHILHHAAKEPVYGLGMMEELRRHGYRISPGTIYPLLRRMETYGWLRLHGDRNASPRQRRCYRITRLGSDVLVLLGRQVAELYRETVREVDGRSPAHEQAGDA